MKLVSVNDRCIRKLLQVFGRLGNFLFRVFVGRDSGVRHCVSNLVKEHSTCLMVKFTYTGLPVVCLTINFVDTLLALLC